MSVPLYRAEFDPATRRDAVPAYDAPVRDGTPLAAGGAGVPGRL